MGNVTKNAAAAANVLGGAPVGARTAKALEINAVLMHQLAGPRAFLIPAELRGAVENLGALLVDMAYEVDGLAGVVYGE